MNEDHIEPEHTPTVQDCPICGGPLEYDIDGAISCLNLGCEQEKEKISKKLSRKVKIKIMKVK
ncbi:MAG: hypothetical protein OEZ48_01480 [Candidatus Bathyarchaeota archaeon]|nr:hypothetical protein [Candidatus Bathyarchaeota archaeon]